MVTQHEVRVVVRQRGEQREKARDEEEQILRTGCVTPLRRARLREKEKPNQREERRKWTAVTRSVHRHVQFVADLCFLDASLSIRESVLVKGRLVEELQRLDECDGDLVLGRDRVLVLVEDGAEDALGVDANELGLGVRERAKKDLCVHHDEKELAKEVWGEGVKRV